MPHFYLFISRWTFGLFSFLAIMNNCATIVVAVVTLSKRKWTTN